MLTPDSDKLVFGSTVAALCLPIGVYFYQKISKSKKKYTEFGQEIIPLQTTVEDIKNGFEDRPYMPFRYPYNQTMSLVKLDVNYWGIMDKQYYHFMNLKKKIFDNYDPEKLKTNVFYKRLMDKEYEPIFQELCDYTVDHYTHRFPNLFSKKGNIVYNHLMDEEYDLTTMDPFLVVTRISMEDFYVTYRKPEEEDRICIGVTVAFGGGGFGITPIVGDSLHSIHKEVPYYEEKLKKSMDKWFERFTDPVERSALHVLWDLDLACADLFAKAREMEHDDFIAYIEKIPFEKFEVRMDRQTLTKLPKSGAVIFANHPVYVNIANQMKDEPLVPSIILKMLYESPEGIIKYKHFEAVRDHIAPDLKKMIDYQIKKGLITADQPVRTIDTFPFASWMGPENFSDSRGYVKP